MFVASGLCRRQEDEGYHRREAEAAFRPIFQVAATKEGADIRIINEPLGKNPPASSVFMVEAGEG